MRVWSCVRSGCFGCGLFWRGLTEMPRLTRTSGIATATWRERLASRGTSPGPRRCHEAMCRDYSACAMTRSDRTALPRPNGLADRVQPFSDFGVRLTERTVLEIPFDHCDLTRLVFEFSQYDRRLRSYPCLSSAIANPRRPRLQFEPWILGVNHRGGNSREYDSSVAGTAKASATARYACRLNARPM